MTWLRGARCTDPEEMPEKEARPPTQNRHGGAPRGERVPLDARRASPGTVPSRAEKARQRKYAPFGAPPVPHWADGKETSKTRAQKCAAGTKKTALFDIVNRNDAATRSSPAERVHRCAVTANSRVPASARLGADFAHGVCTRAPGPRGNTTCHCPGLGCGASALHHLGAIASLPSAQRANSCAVMALPNSGPCA